MIFYQQRSRLGLAGRQKVGEWRRVRLAQHHSVRQVGSAIDVRCCLIGDVLNRHIQLGRTSGTRTGRFYPAREREEGESRLDGERTDRPIS